LVLRFLRTYLSVCERFCSFLQKRGSGEKWKVNEVAQEDRAGNDHAGRVRERRTIVDGP
jgi:hypothetical protein